MMPAVNGPDTQGGVEGKGEGRVPVAAEEDDGEDEAQCPSHLPLAPATADIDDEATTVDPSYIISLIRKLLPHDRITDLSSGSKMELSVSVDESCSYQTSTDSQLKEKIETSPHEDPWEESGCILWDLSMDPNHAKFMVENLLPEVLLANLAVTDAVRVREICLGIFGNLACHDSPRASIVSTAGLVATVVSQLFLEDIACLSEICRLLTVSFQGGTFAEWVDALKSEDMVSRILWIVENTLNLPLLEKSLELLLTIIDTQDVASTLLPPLIKLGLPNLLVNVLASELTKLLDENKLDRIPAVDLILRVIESMSTIDSCSCLISSNDDLFGLVCTLVKLTDKNEVSILCATAVVVIANILTDKPSLSLKLSQDIHFLRGLLDLLPAVATDQPARNALWSILARLLSHVQSEDADRPDLWQHTSVLVDKGNFIMEDVESNCIETDENWMDATTSSLRAIARLLQSFSDKSSGVSEEQQTSKAEAGKMDRLLAFCLKYSF